MKIKLTPEQENKIVEKWLIEVRDIMEIDPADHELRDACDAVLRLNWSYKYETN